MQRLVSITHPALGVTAGSRRFDLLPDVEATILSPYEAVGKDARSGLVRRISMPTSGSGRSARFPSLATALEVLDPDVVHLHADPDTKLALQVARLCGPYYGRGLVLETEMDPAGAGLGWRASLRARQVLSRTDAVLARSAGALAALRRLGSCGLGLIAGRGLEPQALPAREEARRLLQILPGGTKVIGWAGPVGSKSAIVDLLEAMALCERDVVLVIPLSGQAHQDVVDRADALEILDRVRFVGAERSCAPAADGPDLAGLPTMLAAVDALAIAPPTGTLDRACSLRHVELAHVHAIPVIHPNVPEFNDLVGAGGWRAPFRDPALLARLFDALHARPALLQHAAEMAAANALARHSPEAAAAELARAVLAASPMGRGTAPSERKAARRWLRLALRQPGT